MTVITTRELRVVSVTDQYLTMFDKNETVLDGKFCLFGTYRTMFNADNKYLKHITRNLNQTRTRLH